MNPVKNMRSVLLAVVSLTLMALFTGCAGNMITTPASEENHLDKTITYKDVVTIQVPDDWMQRDNKDSDSNLYIDFDNDGMAMLGLDNFEDSFGAFSNQSVIENVIDDYFKGMYETENNPLRKADSETSVNHNIVEAVKDTKYSAMDEVTWDYDDTLYKGFVRLVMNGSNLASAIVMIPEQYYEEAKALMKEVALTLDVKYGNISNSDNDDSSTKKQDSSDSESPKAESSSSQAEASSKTESSPTVSQSNALRMASSYLDYSAFSKTGLIKQLKYEGFSEKDATWAVNNCGANWSEQAVKMGQSYLDYTAFSRSGLIDQLKHEGFTTKQATYAAEKLGL